MDDKKKKREDRRKLRLRILVIVVIFFWLFSMLASITMAGIFPQENLYPIVVPTTSTVTNFDGNSTHSNTTDYWGSHHYTDYDLLVPYTGATTDVNLGSNQLSVTDYVNIGSSADDNSMLIYSTGSGTRNSPYFALRGYFNTDPVDYNFHTSVYTSTQYCFEMTDKVGTPTLTTCSNGTTQVSDDLYVLDDGDFSGDVVIDGWLDIGTALDMAGNPIYNLNQINSNNFFFSGNVTVDDNLGVSKNLTVNGSTLLKGFLNVTGESRFYDHVQIQHGNGQVVSSNSAGTLVLETDDGNAGSISFGNTADIGISRDGEVDGYNYNGAFVFKQKTSNPTEIGEYIFIEENGDWRFALPKSQADLGTYNPRSMIIAGASKNNASNFECSSWGFDALDCNTGGTGADLGVQDDLQVLGNFTVGENVNMVNSTIKENSTTFIIDTGGLDWCIGNC